MNPFTSGDHPSGNSPVRGRGAIDNPANRFEGLRYEADEYCEPAADGPRLPTRLYPDDAQSIIAYNQSPDVGFEASVNPYRGCEHGCVYCYARPTHEFLGCSAGLDFETKLFVKYRAAELLAHELRAPRWRPQPLAMSGVTDCYQPVEAKLKLTRACLEVFSEFRNPVFIITKSRLVVRDADLLAQLASCSAAAVCVSITTLDPALARTIEPRASSPGARLEAIAQLRAAGVPVGVNFAPVIPALNDHEAVALLGAAAEAGAQFAGMGMLRLPLSVATLFSEWLERHYPERKEKVLNRIRSLHDGKLNSTEFVDRMRGHGPVAEQIHQMFEIGRRRAGLAKVFPELSAAAFRRFDRGQLELW